MATARSGRKRAAKKGASAAKKGKSKAKEAGIQHRAVCNDDSFSGPWRTDINVARKDAAAHNAKNPDHDVEVITEQSDAMVKSLTAARDSGTDDGDPFARRPDHGDEPTDDSRVHVLKPGFVCDTEPRGHSTPRGRSVFDIVVDASDGFVPLWARHTTLR